MAAAFPLPVTVSQVGTYFVRQYYQMLQNQPSFLHQFYNDASTMIRIDGNIKESASDMLQIHQLIMSLNYAEIEIKTAHSLQSWNNGVLVMVSGSVRLKGFLGRKKFMQTFFLAPQDKGYFVLNDMLHYVEEEQILHPMAYIHKSNLDPNFHSSATFQEQVPSYILSEDILSREFQPTVEMENDVHLNNYSYHKEQIQQVAETIKNVDDSFAVHTNGSVQGTVNSLPDRFSSPVQESVGEPQKHTYASILAKAQSAPVVTTQVNKSLTISEWQQVPEAPLAEPSNSLEVSGADILDETIPMDDEVETKSVYVKNVPTTMSASEIGEEFKKFGKLRPEGVAIRTRKDIDVCYAFVEFEDISSVQNAIKASTVQIGGHQLYIEGRRPNRNNPFRGGRGRGRSRVSYMMEGTRGRFGGRDFGRIDGQDGNGDYVRSQRGNGFYRPTSRANHQGTRNDQNLYE